MPTSLSNSPLILVTAGDGRGIGPEVITKALLRRFARRLRAFLVIGDIKRIEKSKKTLKSSIPLKRLNLRQLISSGGAVCDSSAMNVLDLGARNDGRDPLRYIDAALELLENKIGRALVTGPVNKETITNSGVKFSGHTEYLAKACGAGDFAMMFVGKNLKVSLVTRHIPLKDVAKSVTKKNIASTALLTYRFLKRYYLMKRPKIAVLALNPHGGEGGTLGREEITVISLAVKSLKRRIPGIKGPIPADSAFKLLYEKRIDALIAMYHDQAMIPVKMIRKDAYVNVTLGLPFIRTSPAHGTAYDIAGKGIADPSSMAEAMNVAASFARRCRT